MLQRNEVTYIREVTKKKSREDGFERDVTIRDHPSYTAEPHARCPKKKDGVRLA